MDNERDRNQPAGSVAVIGAINLTVSETTLIIEGTSQLNLQLI